MLPYHNNRYKEKKKTQEFAPSRISLPFTFQSMSCRRHKHSGTSTSRGYLPRTPHPLLQASLGQTRESGMRREADGTQSRKLLKTCAFVILLQHRRTLIWKPRLETKTWVGVTEELLGLGPSCDTQFWSSSQECSKKGCL